MSHCTPHFRGSGLLSFVLAACGAGSTAQAPTPAAQPDLPDAPALEDQRIEIASIIVAPASEPGQRAALTSVGRVQAHALHLARELAELAGEGAIDVRDCFDAQQRDAGSELGGGELTLQLEIDLEGGVLGGATNPAAGEAGMAAVADCLLVRARQWRFPSRTTPGTTVLIVPYRID